MQSLRHLCHSIRSFHSTEEQDVQDSCWAAEFMSFEMFLIHSVSDVFRLYVHEIK